jgi:hypothetical protein
MACGVRAGSAPRICARRAGSKGPAKSARRDGDLGSERVGVVAGQVAGHGGEGGGVFEGEGLQHLLAQGAGAGVVEHGELRRDAGLQREAAQQRVAEGVDRLDLEPARGLQRPGEEGAGAGEVRGGERGAGLAQRGQFGGERGVGEHRPGAEPGEEPVLHLGRRRLGVGQAEDALGVGAGEQEPRDPVGEHAGLARAGIGRDPGRGAGLGGFDLGAGGVVHARSSATGASSSDHSP